MSRTPISVTVVVRDFLLKLPSYAPGTYVKPDIDGFLRHMKTVILPPRPVPEEVEETTQQQVALTNNVGHGDDIGVDVLADEHDDELIQSYDGSAGSRGKHKLVGGGDEEDIFRKRSRLSYSTDVIH